MANFGEHFKVDISKGKSLPDAVKQGSFYRITILSERLIRLEYSKNKIFNDNLTDLVINRQFEVPKFTCREDDKYLVIETKYFTLQYLKESPFKGPVYAPDTNLKIKLNNTDKTWYYGHPEARNYFGGAFSLEDIKPVFNKLDKGLYSTDGFVSIEDKHPLILNEQGFLSNTNNDSLDIYVFMYKRDFGLCLKDYFTLTGYPDLIPRYALGLWWYRDIIYSNDDVEKLLDMFKTKDIPLSVLLLGEFWHEKDPANYDLRKTGYTFSKYLFPEPKKFISMLHARGVRLGLNIDPCEGISPYDAAYSKFSGELNVNDNTPVPFNALNKTFIANYFTELINKLTALDVDFFWVDYSNDIRNLRCLNYYHITDYKKNEYKRPMLLTRNTNVAPHRNGVLYSGQTTVSWNTLKYLPFYNANLCNIGVTWSSHDIGGFKNGIEDAELYLRYIQFATFSPIFRFSAKRGPYYKREPWLWDFKTYNIAKTYCKLRHQLIPYIYSEGYNYSKNGLPMIQPLYYNYPETYDEPNYRNEYYFGREIFVCPITSPKDKIMNRVIQKIFLPKGTWYELSSGKRFIGGKKYVTFYKDEDYPVFVKAGAIIPLSDFTSNINRVENPESLIIEVYPGKNGTYKLYEDDGITNLFKQGYYNITSIDFNYTKDSYSLSIRPTEGNVAVIPNYRNFKIIFKNTHNVINTKANINGVPVDLETDEVDNDYVINIKNIDVTKELIIRINGNNIDIDTLQLANSDIDSIINDLNIETVLKEKIAQIAFSNIPIKKKRIEITKLKKEGLQNNYIKMFMKIYDYLGELQ